MEKNKFKRGNILYVNRKYKTSNGYSLKGIEKVRVLSRASGFYGKPMIEVKIIKKSSSYINQGSTMTVFEDSFDLVKDNVTKKSYSLWN